MHVKRRDYKEPSNEDTTIWRYMDLIKFIDLIDSRALFFCAVSCLDDPFEGSLEGSRTMHDIDSIFGNKEDRDKNFIDTGNRAKKGYMANCWHMNEFESDSMWKKYINKCKNTIIAVKSTYNNWSKSFDNSKEDVFIGVVEYIDYNDPNQAFADQFIAAQFLHKRKQFEDEHEIRALIRDLGIFLKGKPPIAGKKVDVDVNILINEVYVSPGSSDWEIDVIKSLMTKYEIQAPIKKSKIDDIPEF